jgi:hypothetical protein
MTLPFFRRPVVLFTALLLALLGPHESALAATDKLPDLTMARLSDFSIDTSSGRRLLRFSTTMVNIGAGAFEVHAVRSSASTQSFSQVVQRINNDAGGYRDVPISSASLVWGGDGHNHWHVRDIQQYEFTSPTGNISARYGAKTGFCFYDNVRYKMGLPGAKGKQVYKSTNSCVGFQSLDVMMGLSIGWGDRYHASLPGQYIDITGVPAGDYRLTVRVDPSSWFQETNEGNNATWVNLRINTDGSLTILGYGPGA